MIKFMISSSIDGTVKPIAVKVNENLNYKLHDIFLVMLGFPLFMVRE